MLLWWTIWLIQRVCSFLLYVTNQLCLPAYTSISLFPNIFFLSSLLFQNPFWRHSIFSWSSVINWKSIYKSGFDLWIQKCARFFQHMQLVCPTFSVIFNPLLLSFIYLHEFWWFQAPLLKVQHYCMKRVQERSMLAVHMLFLGILLPLLNIIHVKLIQLKRRQN